MIPPHTVLAGDIGGTKTLLQLARIEAGQAPQVLRQVRYASGEHADLADMVRAFLDGDTPKPSAACFGVAGPVEAEDTAQRAQLTNLPWRLHSRELAEALDLARVRLINDFQAVAYGIEALGPHDLAPLQEAPAQAGAPRAVLGAGTGLGVALLCPRPDGGYEAYPTEGGHVEFAPTDSEQIALLEFLLGEYTHVSCERLLSGPGLVNCYRFQCQRHGQEAPLLQRDDPAAAIAAAADEGVPLAADALRLFSTIYGATAGNLALTTLARGGLYLAGGIAPKILPWLQRGEFMAAFRAKGRMHRLMDLIPVQVVTNSEVGLLGAAVAASRLQAP